MNLKPHEYWAMDFEEWHTAIAVQSAYRDGADMAVEKHRKQQENEREDRQMLEELKTSVGG